MKKAIVCTYRTGSTLLCDVIANTYSLTNKGEYLSDGLMHLTQNIVSLNTLSKKYTARVEKLKQNNDWVVKLITTPCFFGKEVLNNADLIFLYRRDIVKQFESEVNMAYRGRLAKKPFNHFTTGTQPIIYDTIDVQPETLTRWVIGFVQRLEVWRLTYDAFGSKDKLVCYEDHIENFNLQHIGVTTNTSPLIKTPYTTTNLKYDSWQKYVDFLQHYEYITNL